MKDFFEQFSWHSCIGVDDAVGGSKKFVTRLANTKRSSGLFIAAGGNLLIHKATQALWKLSEDGKFIEPVFDTDILTESDLDLEKS